MKRQPLFPVITALLISSCSGERLLTPDTTRFSVDSVPPQATVYVMGEAIGVTPTDVMRRQVFPHQYPESLQDLYGAVTLRHPDCLPYNTNVSNRILEQGLTAQLQCNSHSTPADKSPAPAMDNRERLLELKSLHEEGLLTEQEYRQKRRAILDAL
ncbi:MAG: hypothetical protein R6X15_07550 [Pseudomonadota bacterium]